MSKPKINIVWFKRDLRIEDHTALCMAAKEGLVLPIFSWDPLVWSSLEYSKQHVMFVRECLDALKKDFEGIGLQLFESFDGMINILNSLKETYHITGLFSHQETGNQNSYFLDTSVATWCQNHQIPWHEFPQNGVIRALKNRDDWQWLKEKRMAIPINSKPKVEGIRIEGYQYLEASFKKAQHLNKIEPDKPFRQKGGRFYALAMLNSFLNGRASKYRGGISSPISAIDAGSRISPYLAWGVLSIKEVLHALAAARVKIKQNPQKYPVNLEFGLRGFENRLHWHCHFMQKLESEPTLEYKNLHRALEGLRDETYQDPEIKERLDKWKSGNTGWPFVDACMAMLRETGWINFRMRAMLMSNASYLFWLHWREPGLHLAREFLDYEPGIHWPQVQMQSGTTGINAIRIYNPIKQAREQDPNGDFVRKWVPALRHLSNNWIFEPWLMTPELQREFKCIIGKDYPAPLINFETAYREAKRKMQNIRKNKNFSQETNRIIKKHASRKGITKRNFSKKMIQKESIQGNKDQLALF